MKIMRYTDSQMLSILKQNLSGTSMPDLYRKHNLRIIVKTGVWSLADILFAVFIIAISYCSLLMQFAYPALFLTTA